MLNLLLEVSTLLSLGAISFAEWTYRFFKLSCDLALVKDPFIRNPLIISHNLSMFGDHWSSASTDIKYLIFHVTSQNHLMEGSCKFMNKTSLLYVTTMSSLVAIDIVVIEI